MPQITAIKPQKRGNDKLNIYLDGKFAFSVTTEILLRENLKEGQEISSNKVTALIEESELSAIFDKVLRFLSFRPRSEFEINEYLLRKNVGEETRKMVMQKLKVLKLIDDEAFARWWVEQRSTFRPRGIRMLKYELRRKGIDRDLIEKTIKENRSPATDLLLAEKLVQKKLSRLKNLPEAEAKKKLYRSLLQKGFSFEVLQKAVAKFFKKG